MPRLAQSRFLLAFVLPLAASAQKPAPSTLPATPPTQPPVVQSAPAYQPPPEPTAQRARITYAAGQLAVTADNSSLNQILRDISRQTGLKITGGVRDERVFGTYGPASTDTVLAALLTGTGSNILLKQSSGDAPQELVITPRQGGPTPPSPASSQTEDRDDDADIPPQRVRPPMPVPATPLTNVQSAAEQQQTPQQQQPTTDQSNTGVRTPQQIYDQLMKLQQQKSTAPPQ